MSMPSNNCCVSCWSLDISAFSCNPNTLKKNWTKHLIKWTLRICLWWTWMNDCDWMTHLMTLWPKKKEPRFEFISAMAENLVWQLVVSAYVRYIYIYIHNTGALTVNIEFMWRGLETGERSFSEAFHPFRAKLILYLSCNKICKKKNVIEFNNKKKR